MINEAIIKLAAKEDLSYEMAMGAMDEIMGGKATPVQMSAFLTAMSMKGETIEEITACAAGMRKHCIRLLNDQELLEIVGTGGDRSNSFNISTTASILVSAAGVPVAKHGNRAASSKSGAADCLEALGVKISLPPEEQGNTGKDQSLFSVCAELSSVHEICSAGSKRAGNPDDLQYSGSADQSCRGIDAANGSL